MQKIGLGKSLTRGFVLALLGLLLISVPASARLVGSEFSVYGNIPHESWGGGVAWEGSGNIAMGVLTRETASGPLQPWIGWFTGGSWGYFHSLHAVSSNSSYPHVTCAGNYKCLATWTAGGKVYARIVGKPNAEYDGDLWTVDDSGRAESSVVAAYDGLYLVAWYTDHGRIGLRYVKADTGPVSSQLTFYLTPPSGCSLLACPKLLYEDDSIFVAFSCPVEGKVHVQAWKEGTYLYDPSYAWNFSPTLPGGKGYLPDVARDNSGNLLTVWQSSTSSNSRLYGQRLNSTGGGLSSTFTILAANDGQTGAWVTHYAREDEYLVVFRQADDIYYARLKSDGSSAGAPYAVTAASGVQLHPRAAWLGFNETSGSGFSPDNFLVLWTDLSLGSNLGTVRGRWVELEKMLGDNDPFSNEADPGGEDHYQAPANAGQWQAVGLRPGAGSDFDLRLYASPEYIPGSELASSINGEGQVDLVVMNGHQSSQSAYFPLASQYSGDNYVIEYAPRAGQITQDNSSANGSMDAGAVIQVFDVYAKAGQPITLQVAPSGVDVGAAIFDPGAGAHQSLGEAAASADSGGAGQSETIVYTPAQSGWIGLAIWKNDGNSGSIALSSSGAGTPPNNNIYLPLVVR